MLQHSDGSVFTASWASFRDTLPGQPIRRDAKVYIQLAVGTPTITLTAMLDTGAAFSVLHADLAEELGAFDDADAPPLKLATRHGLLPGHLVRRPAWLLAEDGESLEVDATFWVSRAWRHGHFLGYGGLLQRIRFALDPESNQFHFGPI